MKLFCIVQKSSRSVWDDVRRMSARYGFSSFAQAEEGRAEKRKRRIMSMTGGYDFIY
jgi:hypothetical protein